MPSIEKDIKLLERTVLEEARAGAEKNLAEAREKADGLKRQASQQAAAERTKILAQATLEAERLRSQALAIAQLESRTSALEEREELLRRVFEAAQERLPEIQQSPAYNRIAPRLLREALHHLGAGSATIRADRATRKILSSSLLAKMARELKMDIQVGEPLTDRIGVIAETTDGRRQYDNTLETRLNRLQAAVRPTVHRLLMGESQ
jgi:V/A-type H+-transporting ATPase subunit E